MRKPELESALEQRCVAKIEARGGLALKLRPPTGRGFPDRLIMVPGSRTWGAEFKRQKIGKVSTQQIEWRRRLTAAGVPVFFIDADAHFDQRMREMET